MGVENDKKCLDGTTNEAIMFLFYENEQRVALAPNTNKKYSTINIPDPSNTAL